MGALSSLGVLIFCHGRSGSTLLLEALSLTNLASYFEPLQKLRTPSNMEFSSRWFSNCMENRNDPENFPEGIYCPQTDALLITNQLRCRLVMNAAMTLSTAESSTLHHGFHPESTDHKTDGQNEIHMQKKKVWDSNTTDLFREAVFSERKCHKKAEKGGGVMVKEIRANGYLENVVLAWKATSMSDASISNHKRRNKSQKLQHAQSIDDDYDAYNNEEQIKGDIDETLRVVQLIRDPRGLISSRLNLGWGHPPELSSIKKNIHQKTKSNLTNQSEEIEEEKQVEKAKDVLRQWSRQLCNETMKDIHFGIHFESLNTQNSYKPPLSPLKVQSNSHVHKQRENVSFMIVRFEDLVMHLLETLNIIYEFVGVHPKEQKLLNYISKKQNFNKSASLQSKTSYNTTPRNQTEAINSWKERLAQWQIAIINEQCYELLQLMYPDTN